MPSQVSSRPPKPTPTKPRVDDVTRDCGMEYYGDFDDVETVTSDGGPTSYYELPEHATELRHLISYKGMSFARGNLFKACYRLGEKSGTGIQYDLNKMKLFIDDLIEMHGRGEAL